MLGKLFWRGRLNQRAAQPFRQMYTGTAHIRTCGLPQGQSLGIIQKVDADLFQ